MSSLVERRRAEGVRHDQTILAAAAAAGDMGLEPKELAERADLPDRTVRAVVARLCQRGLLRRQGERGRIFATMAGRGEVGAGVDGRAMAGALAEAIGELPTESHRAFARLLVSGVVARHCLHDHYDSGWPGFIAIGPTNTGKTGLARFAAAVFGLKRPDPVRLLSRETPGSIVARRRQSAGRWTIERSALMDLPLLCLDEYDKAPDDVRREAGSLLLGSTLPDLEDQVVEVRPLVMVMLNSRPGELGRTLHDAYVRRAVVIDTEPLEPLLADIDEAMHRLFRPGRIPQLDLGRIELPATELPAAARSALRSALKEHLTPDGWRLADTESLSRLALGRVALLPEPDLERAALATAFDYVIVATTMGHAEPDAVGDLRGQLLAGADGAATALVPSGAAAVADQAVLATRRNEREQAEIARRLQFEQDRARTSAELLDLVRRLGRPQDPESKSIVTALRKANAEVTATRSPSSLKAALLASGPLIRQAQDRIDQRERERTAADQQRRQQREAIQQQQAVRRQQKVWQRQQQAQQKEYRATERKSWQDHRAKLRAMMPYESLGGLLADLTAANWLREVPIQRPEPAGWWGRVTRAFEPTTQHVLAVNLPGLVSGGIVTMANVVEVWTAAYDQADRQAVSWGARPARRPAVRQKGHVDPTEPYARALDRDWPWR